MRQWVLKKPYLKINGNLLEGPFYDEQTGQARFIDIADRNFYTFVPSKGPESLKVIKTQETIGVTANIRGSSNELIVGARSGVAKLNPVTGTVTYLCEFWPSSAEISQRMRSNDGAVDSRGRLWVGAISEQLTENPEGVLFRVDPDLSIHTMLANLHAPNGIGWNLTESIMYFTDSTSSNIYAFDFDVEKGTISKQRVFFHVVGEGEFPDGLAVDGEDCVWTALWGGGRVLRIEPEGKVIGEVIIPSIYVTCPAFIGTELLITTRGDPEIEEDSIEKGGDIYMVEVGVRGALKHDFVLGEEVT
ncbi:hypothetical protein BGZ60DRAFT_421372 [Tricladium varicosporioides]|nr:hypothetical protein BGZ60DRAFT_421372 [Hymenoscyphus varicosporioides]